jgi:hypothetical protein
MDFQSIALPAELSARIGIRDCKAMAIKFKTVGEMCPNGAEWRVALDCGGRVFPPLPAVLGERAGVRGLLSAIDKLFVAGKMPLTPDPLPECRERGKCEIIRARHN